MLPYLHAKPRSGLNCGLLPWSFTVSSCFRFVSIVGVVVYFVQKMVIGFCQALSMEGRKVVCRVETSPFAKCAMKTGTALVFAASLCVPLSFFPILPSTAAAKTVIQGHARIVDGDTVRIGDNRIRLLGIDAPETKQTCTDQKGLDYLCGATSTEKLKAFMGEDSILRCESEKKDRYGRELAVCYNKRGEDLNAKMVKEGWATAFSTYSTKYLPEQEIAKKDRRGLWSGKFENPADYRRVRREKLRRIGTE